MIKLDFKRDTPIYEQIIEQIKLHVVKGNIKPGMPIPSVRKLALELSVTPGTVAKAYQELERQGVIETVRGKGAFISGEIKKGVDEARLKSVKVNMEPAILELKMMGLSEKEIINVVKELYSKLS